MAAGRFGRRFAPAASDDPEDRIAALVDAHEASLLRVARQHSLCLDDAHDAYQRALEIYLRRLDTVDAATEGAWMKVVTHHHLGPPTQRSAAGGAACVLVYPAGSSGGWPA